MIRERVPRALEILETSKSYREGLARINEEFGPTSGDSLWKGFKKAGLGRPMGYVGLRRDAPVAGIANVAQNEQQLESGQLLKVLIVPDVHVPYHDTLAWRTVLEVGRNWKPDTAVILGDFGDFYQVSQHPKDPSRRVSFGDEIDAVLTEMQRFSNLNIPRVIFCEGNHETRFQRLVNAMAPALAEVTGIAKNARELLDVQKRFSWEWVPYGHHISIGKLSFMHDAGHAGMYAAKQSVASFGASIVFGHTHRAGAHYESTVSGDRHVGWTMGWLGDPEAIDYRHCARVLRESQHGFGVAYIEESAGLFWTHFVPIIGGRAVVDGQVFDGRMYDL